MPYNLLVEKGQSVWIYEVPFFMQWGTPEDLEEYLSWSDYFRSEADWRPSIDQGATQVLIPMVGAGIRFKSEGYKEPKPLVTVAGTAMVKRSLDSYLSSSRWVCVMREEDACNPAIVSAVQSPGRDLELVSVQGMTEGQACTCLLGLANLDLEKPLLIAPCDSGLVYDENRLAEITADLSVDCVVWTFRNHPHANRNPHQYGWVKVNQENQIEKISCKKALSLDVRKDPGIIGVFWFRKAKYFRDAAEELILQNRRVNNEFYADSAIEILVEQGLKAKIFDIQRLICFGVPPDVKTFEYWESFFRQNPSHPYGKTK